MTPTKDAGSADHVGDGHGGLWDGRSDWRGAGEAMGTEEPHAALHPATKKIMPRGLRCMALLSSATIAWTADEDDRIVHSNTLRGFDRCASTSGSCASTTHDHAEKARGRSSLSAQANLLAAAGPRGPALGLGE